MGWLHFDETISAYRKFTSSFSSCQDKLFATMHTVIISLASIYSVFLFTTLSDKDGFINHSTTERAEAHRSICSPMVKVGALLSLHYHSSLSLHLHDCELSGSSAFLSLSFFSQMALCLTSEPGPFLNPSTLTPLLSLG